MSGLAQDGWDETFDLFMLHQTSAERVSSSSTGRRNGNRSDQDEESLAGISEHYEARCVCSGCHCTENALQGALYHYCRCNEAWHATCFAQRCRGERFRCFRCETNYSSIDIYVNRAQTESFLREIAKQQVEDAQTWIRADPAFEDCRIQALADTNVVGCIRGGHLVRCVRTCFWMFVAPVILAASVYLLTAPAAFCGYTSLWLPYFSDWHDFVFYTSTIAWETLTLNSGLQLWIGIMVCVGTVALVAFLSHAALIAIFTTPLLYIFPYSLRTARDFIQLLRLGVPYARDVHEAFRMQTKECSSDSDSENCCDEAEMKEVFHPRANSPTIFARTSSYSVILGELTDSRPLASQFQSWKAEMSCDQRRAEQKAYHAAAVSLLSRSTRSIQVCRGAIRQVCEPACMCLGLSGVFGCLMACAGGLIIAVFMILPRFTVLPLMRSNAAVYDMISTSQLASGVLTGDCAWTRGSALSCWNSDLFRDLESGNAVWIPTQRGWVAAFGVEERAHGTAPLLRILRPPISYNLTLLANTSGPIVALTAPLTSKEIALYAPAHSNGERLMWCSVAKRRTSDDVESWQFHALKGYAAHLSKNSTFDVYDIRVGDTGICVLPQQPPEQTSVRTVHVCMATMYGDASFQVRSSKDAELAWNANTHGSGPNNDTLYGGHTWWGYIPLRGKRMGSAEFADIFANLAAAPWLDLRSSVSQTEDQLQGLHPRLSRAELDVLTLQVGWRRILERLLARGAGSAGVNSSIASHFHRRPAAAYPLYIVKGAMNAVDISTTVQCTGSQLTTSYKAMHNTSQNQPPVLMTSRVITQPLLHHDDAPLATASSREIHAVETHAIEGSVHTRTVLVSLGFAFALYAILSVIIPLVLLILMMIVTVCLVEWRNDLTREFQWLLWEAPASLLVMIYSFVEPSWLSAVVLVCIANTLRVDVKLLEVFDLLLFSVVALGNVIVALWFISENTHRFPLRSQSSHVFCSYDVVHPFCGSKSSVRERCLAVLLQVCMHIVATIMWIAVPIWIRGMLRRYLMDGIRHAVQAVLLTEVKLENPTETLPSTVLGVVSLLFFLGSAALVSVDAENNIRRLTLLLLAPLGLARFRWDNKTVQHFLDNSAHIFRRAHDGWFDKVFTWLLDAPLSPVAYAQRCASYAEDDDDTNSLDDDNSTLLVARRHIVTRRTYTYLDNTWNDVEALRYADVEALVTSGTNTATPTSRLRRHQPSAHAHVEEPTSAALSDHQRRAVRPVRATTRKAFVDSGYALAYAMLVMLLQGCCFWLVILPFARALVFVVCNITLEQRVQLFGAIYGDDFLACSLGVVMYVGLGVHSRIWCAFHGSLPVTSVVDGNGVHGQGG